MSDKLQFIHLRVHTAYSLAEGAVRPGTLAKLCQDNDMPAVAVADTGNMFGALELSENLSGNGVQPIPACALTLAFEEDDPAEGGVVTISRSRGNRAEVKPMGPDRIVLIAQSEKGYQNLLALVSRSYMGTDPGDPPHITMEDLESHADDLILLTGGSDGPLGRLVLADRAGDAEDLLLRLKVPFGDRLYMEVQRHGTEAEEKTEEIFLDMAYRHDVPLVATNEVFFATPDMHEAHDALLCIADGAYVSQDDRRRKTRDQYFKSQSEMVDLFSDLPEAIDNTIEIAKRCHFRPLLSDPILPRFGGADGRDEAAELRAQAEEGLKARLAIVEPAAPVADYESRLAFELDVIEQMGFPGYFLIVSDFIKWAKTNDIPVGPGRGSGAGSVVAWALTITDLDPLRFGLLFERFLNPERVSMPDFDIDFCQDRRDEVIKYVQDKYGSDQVAQIITFGKLQARAVLRDVGRVLQMSYGQVDRLCKMVPNNPANPTTLAEALKSEPALAQARREEEIVDRLITIALQLEGLYRHASTHAAGVVIGDRPLDQLVPLYRDPRSDMAVTQFNMKWVEPAGLVKFDFLGLKTLSVIQRAVNLLKNRGIEVDIGNLPLDDKKTFDLLSSGNTIGVFQLEGSGMRDMMRRMKPDVFEDIIAIVALYRPGPMDNIPKFINTKQGREEADYHHPWLEDLLKETYGVIVYQEQVMQIAQILAGYSLGDADLLRRAMGKKIKSEMDKQKALFVDGAVEKGVKKADADHIFDLVAKFAGYGFNKSHAAAYALVAYQTAWLKANHPVEFMAASMTYDMNNTDKLGLFKGEATRMGITVNPPNINRSDVAFSVSDGEIHYALAAVKNVGGQAMADIVRERQEGGAFRDPFEFARRVDPKALNKRTLENLARAGAFDELDDNRRRIFGAAQKMMDFANRSAQDRASNQTNMFGDVLGDEDNKPQLDDVEDWTPMERLQEEFGAVGFFLSGHPLDDYQDALRAADVVPFARFMEALTVNGKENARVAGTVTARQERRSAKGNPFAFVKLTDATGEFEVTVFSDQLRDHRDLLEPGQSVVLALNGEMEGETPRLRVNRVSSLDNLAARERANLSIFVEGAEALPSILKRLPKKDARGGEVKIICLTETGGREVEIRLPDRYAISPADKASIRDIQAVSDAR